MSLSPVCRCGCLEREHAQRVKVGAMIATRPCRRRGCQCLRFTLLVGVVGLQGNLYEDGSRRFELLRAR